MSERKAKFTIAVFVIFPLWAGLLLYPGACAFARGAESAFAGKTASAYTIPVIELSYIPSKSGKVDISVTGDWQNERVADLVANVKNLSGNLVTALETGSIYHGYKNKAARPSLKYKIVEKKTFYTPVPINSRSGGMDGATPYPDHMKILEGLDICRWVNTRGVKEVWIWMYHTKKAVPIESNMAGPYGDISNSVMANDLPKCGKTYVVYDYNYGRSVSMAVEDHTHQIEAVLRHVDENLFWKLFVGTENGGGRCGWTHYPPNGVRDYDWNNTTGVMSDCEDWMPKGGKKSRLSCRTWATNPSACDNDEGLSFKIWWMQNIPGAGNRLFYEGRRLKNWWALIGDFDGEMRSKSLYYGFR